MNFGSYKDYDMTNRFFNRNLAGGALLDIGVYALYCISLFPWVKAPSSMVSVKLAPTSGWASWNRFDEWCWRNGNCHDDAPAKQPKRGVIAYDKVYIEIVDYPLA